MQYSARFIDKLKKVFPRAKGLHFSAETGKVEMVGSYIEQYHNEITEEQFGRTFYLTPPQAQEQFPAYLEELRELEQMWMNETSNIGDPI